MAINKERCQQLLLSIDVMFNSEFVNNYTFIPGIKPALVWVKEKILGEGIKELRRLVDEMRPPVFYLLGRAGHGKSSLINALADQEIAEVGKGGYPKTAETKVYHIPFPGRHADWRVYDSRGIFEIKAPAGAAAKDAAAVAREDILQHDPDVILHVISIAEVRALGKDLEVMREIQEEVRKKTGARKPVVVVLTKADTLGGRREWPPEHHPDTASEIEDYVKVMAQHGMDGGAYESIKAGAPFLGCKILGDSPYLYVVPVNVRDRDDRWNMDRLIEVIGGELPDGARLQFYQALQRKELLRRVSSDVITKFSGIAAAVTAVPIPIPDFFMLAPLQMLMIAVVAGLSCREPSMESVKEYAAACGVAFGAGYGLRQVFTTLLKFIPIAGGPIAAVIASSGTYALGKSAEAYFFSGETRKPEEFKDAYQNLPK